MNVFDFAMDVERSGMKYYRRLANKTENKGIRRIFSMMAKDEEMLLRRFQAMRGRVQNTTMEDSRVLDYAANIFEGLLDDNDALRMETDLDAYNYVLEVEKAICQLYRDAAEREKNDEVRGLLRKIGAEEHRELESLEKIYDFVNAPNEYLAWGEFSNLDEFHNFGRYEG
ncbi:ferritin [Desulfuromonas versatilis]|uniref:Ferritin n=1 Tax=Desulfuromonas versatilis TaxID=2802975 RepID=A0ABM8HTT9_9BACT|nr:ferritin family protein [Desulfuromonas versatilis]BCR04116.1 ferritin [Desulfuromonas versatilis]